MADRIKDMRDFAAAILTRRYGSLEAVTGQGIQHGARVKFMENGKKVICAIKGSENRMGRIHFPYKDGTWGSLSEVDRILCVREKKGQMGEFEAQMFTKETLIDAFNENRRAAEANDFTNLPAWLSPDLEEAERFAGSGFGKHAVWTESSSLVASTITKTLQDVSEYPIGRIIAKAKESLARELGVAASAVEITIRWP